MSSPVPAGGIAAVPGWVRRMAAALLVGILVLGGIRTYNLLSSNDLPIDFIQYWAVGRLLAAGENPYDAALQLREQRRVYPERDIALMMWNPPPALPLYVPLGLMPARVAAIAWNAGQLVAVLAACLLLWRVYAGPDGAALALLLGGTFAGSWWLLVYGQNTGLILLGLALFAWGMQQRRPAVAGLGGALTVLKPHLLLGFGVLWAMDLADRERRRAVLWGVAAGLLAGLAAAGDPQVYEHFWQTLREPGPHAVPLRDWMLPTASYWLRYYLAPEVFAVQFVPAAAVVAGLVAVRLAYGCRGNWPTALPVVVAISFLTTPYGGWIFDLPVLLVPVVAAGGYLYRRGRYDALMLLVLAQFGITWATLLTARTLHGLWWVAPAVLAVAAAAWVGRR